MRCDWKECTLSDLGEIVGGATPSTKRPENYGGNISWITPKDLSNFHGRFISRGERNITEAGLKSCSARLMPKNTILFSSRAPIGYVAIAANELCTNQGFKSIIPNDDTDFMFLLKYNKNAIELMSNGTTFKEISGSVMKNITVCVPKSKEVQKKISAILSPLDDKIELNRRINANLEQQARAIYSHMLSECDCSEVVLSDIADVIMGQSPKGSTYNENGIGTIFFQGRGEFGFRFPKRRLYTTDPKRMAKADDVLLSVRAPVGDVNVAHEDCCIGRGLCAVRSKNNHQSFLLYTMFSLRQQLDIFNGQGTVFGAINRDALKSLSVTIPSQEAIDRFENIVSPMDRMIHNNYSQTCCLESIRDALISKLISGEADLKNFPSC